MKVLVFLLVLANLLFLAFTEGYFGRPDNPDAARMEQQVNGERIKVVARGEAPVNKASPAPVAEGGEGKAKVADANPEPVKEAAAKEAAKAAPETSCLAWSGLPARDADRLSALLAEKFDGFRQSRRLEASEGAGWWVFIPPLPTKADAEKKAAELKRLGVSDYFIIQEAGPNRYALSLGVFSAESGAKERLAELKADGVKSARMGPRPGKDSLHVIEASGPAARQAALLAAVAGILPALRSQECR